MSSYRDAQHRCARVSLLAKPTAVRGLLVALLLALLAPGCAQQRYITRRQQPNRYIPRQLVALSRAAPKPTPRTLQLLRRYDLVDLQQKNPENTLTKLQVAPKLSEPKKKTEAKDGDSKTKKGEEEPKKKTS